jgi:peptide subunit release factor 1 (eRF1)
MKLVSQEQIETLAKLKSPDYLTTSFFLDTSKNRMTKKEINLGFKNLYNTAKGKLDQMSISKRERESLHRDLGKIKKYCSQNLSSYNFVGLAIFSCAGRGFWQDFNLVKSPRNLVIFDQNPYIRPLSAILDEYHKICVFTLNRKEAKWYDVYMGEIFLLDTLVGDVPSKVREGGWEGYNSKRIERHVATHLHDFFKNASQITFSLMNKNKFDWLFLGCQDEHYPEINPLLHPYLKRKLKGRLKVKPPDSLAKILDKTLDLKNELKQKEKKEIVQKFITELEKGGLATSGIKNTLRKLNRGEVQILLVTRHFSKAGRKCPKCHFLFTDESICPFCQIKTNPMDDIIDEAVETALNSSCQIKHINPPTRLNRYGSIGAFLRYKA